MGLEQAGVCSFLVGYFVGGADQGSSLVCPWRDGGEVLVITRQVLRVTLALPGAGGSHWHHLHHFKSYVLLPGPNDKVLTWTGPDGSRVAAMCLGELPPSLQQLWAQHAMPKP